MLEVTCVGSNPHNETQQFHQPGLWCNIELNLDVFLNTMIHHSLTHYYCSTNSILLITSLIISSNYLLIFISCFVCTKIILLMKVHGLKHCVPVNIRFRYNKLIITYSV